MVQIFMGTVCRLLVTAGENAKLMVVTALKKCSVAEKLLSNSAIVLFVVVVVMEIDRKHYFWSDLHKLTASTGFEFFQEFRSWTVVLMFLNKC